jgi:hypothetical protein
MIFTKVPLCGLSLRLCAFAVKTTIQNSEEPEKQTPELMLPRFHSRNQIRRPSSVPGISDFSVYSVCSVGNDKHPWR